MGKKRPSTYRPGVGGTTLLGPGGGRREHRMRLMDWEVLAPIANGRVRRAGRFVVAELDGPHLVLSTSARTGGQVDDVRVLVNHQSCEGAGHDARAHLILDEGPDRYH